MAQRAHAIQSRRQQSSLPALELRQHAAIRFAAQWAWLPVFGVMALVVVANVQFDMATEVALRDTNAIAGFPWYYGAISNLGIVAWLGTAAVLLFAYAVRRIHGLTRTAPSRMLLEFGLLTMLLRSMIR